ncbi:hypothetical protein [Paenibacillus sp. L3-i20]|uniref:hypothetical protein n=1 Tax=Paenibacillus sp. L3-i20 TaxID=2905833 RepID=UPI001EE0F8C1|nr:hypothetical protein [Paenibacillus sp. L3-i20]GKU78948.1 hypothetical protein L3i20_v233450 [Paenibacillus sp. L3-i20]
MNPSRPDWYDDLQGNPLKQKTFTNELADKIRSRTISTVQAPPRLRQIYWAGGAILLAIGLGLILFSRETHISDRLITVAGVPVPSKENFMVIPVIPTDAQLLELIKREYDNLNRQIIFKDIIDETSMLLFTNRIVSGKSKRIWEVSYANWNSNEQAWTIEKKGELPIDYVTATEYEKALEEGEVLRFSGEKMTSPTDPSSDLLFGLVSESRVSSVRITDHNNVPYNAIVIHDISGSLKLWYTFIPKTEGNINVEALNRDGLVLDEFDIK